MSRFAILIALLWISTAYAGAIPRAQRKAMATILKNFAPTLSKTECRDFLDQETKFPIGYTREQTVTHLIATADHLTKAVVDVRDFARAGEVERTRIEIRNVARRLARAARLAGYKGRYDVGDRVKANVKGAALTMTCASTAFSGAALGSNAPALALVGAGFLTASVVALARGDRLPPLLGVSPDLVNSRHMDMFWSRLSRNLRREVGLDAVDLKNVDDLKALLSREFHEVSFEQACQGALVHDQGTIAWP